MPRPVYQEFNPEVGFRTQLQAEVEGPIVLVNVFTVAPGDGERMKAVWEADAAVMKRQPGFISAQLHEGVADSGVFMNYAVWQSKAHLLAATGDPDFQAAISNTPDGVVARPHVFKRIAIPNVCVG